MRILHLIDSGGVYGAERILLYLAREQQRLGDEPILGSISRPGSGQTPLEALAQAWGVPVVPIRIGSRPTPGVVRTLLNHSQALGIDLLHSHGYKANILLGSLPRRWRGPMISTLHGWTGGRRFSALWLYERLDRWSIGRVDSVVVVTRSMLKLPALRRIPAARRHLVENGIPPLQARLADLAARNTAALPAGITAAMHQTPTLLAIGRLSPEKGFGNLIEAFAKVRAEGIGPCRFVIVGEGSQRAVLTARIAALGLQESVVLLGYLEGAERMLEHAAGFVMSSLTEGMPLVLLEAMQWRVPILATSVGAIPELLDYGKRGQLVPPGSVETLTDGLRQLMTSLTAARKETVERAYTAVQQHYTSARMADEYRRLYQEIA
jgi:glycosyltransferase involved in cell wall biosynthesis